ncbi:MAG: hypothetical protein ACLFUH_09825 [Bacteroidales bacterium]
MPRLKHYERNVPLRKWKHKEKPYRYEMKEVKGGEKYIIYKRTRRGKKKVNEFDTETEAKKFIRRKLR